MVADRNRIVTSVLQNHFRTRSPCDTGSSSVQARLRVTYLITHEPVEMKQEYRILLPRLSVEIVRRQKSRMILDNDGNCMRPAVGELNVTV